MKYKVIFLLLIFVFVVGGVEAAGVADASYLGLRDYTYGLLNDPVLDEEEFTKLIVDQGYKYRFVDWIGDVYHSIFFNNPKGSEVLYNDFVMALCIGFERIGKPENLVEPLTKIINRRIRMWHGTVNSNHYAREYASLASLAYLIDDSRLENLQVKVRNSVNELYLSDGYAYEGPEYGLYSMSILSGYVYFTGDELVRQKIINNINWLASISSSDRYKPPFDDSLARQLPYKINAFEEVNDFWQSNFTFNNIPEKNTYNDQETVWRYNNGTTLWVRHRNKNKEWQGLHRNYSNGDVVLKVEDVWWLVAPGYMGWENKQARPQDHNVAMSKMSYMWRGLWRVLGGEAELIRRDDSDINKAVLGLDGNILRTIEFDDKSLVVTDASEHNFKQFWQINGELIAKNQAGDSISLQWQQGDKILNQLLSGVYSISVEPSIHTGENKSEVLEHNRLIVEGKNLIVRFAW